MTTRLIDIKQSELNPTLRVLSDAGITTDDFDWIRQKANAGKVAEFLRGVRGLADANPFAHTAEEILNRLRLANKEEGWGLGEEVFDRLAKTAPKLPSGRLSFLTLRIRFGEGQEGVAKTFEAHAKRVENVFGKKAFRRWEHLRSDKDRLRLLNGNDTHKSAVEWATVDLGANRKRESVEAVRGKPSLADEGLALAWLHPEYVRAIDYDENPAFFLAGYELSVPVRDVESWQRVPRVLRDLGTGGVYLVAGRYDNGHSAFSVPFLGSAVL